MQRLSMAVVLAIAFLGGCMVALTIERPISGESAVSRSTGTEIETARAFYLGLNQAYAGGGTDTLAALLSPSFLDHETGTGTIRSTAEFLQYLDEEGHTGSAVQLAVVAIEGAGSNVIVRLSQVGTGPQPLAGIAIEQVGLRSFFEVLRLARGRVVDRWSPGIAWVETSDFDDLTLSVSGHPDLATILVRVVIPAGGEHDWDPVGPGFVVIESGTAERRALLGEPVVLEQGSTIRMTRGDRIRLRALNDEPVRALISTVVRRGATEAQFPTSALNARSNGVEQTLLWSGSGQLGEGLAVHRLGIAKVPAGSEIRLLGGQRSVVLAVDSGTLEVTAPESTLTVLDSAHWPVEQPNFARIDASHGASVFGMGDVLVRNASAATVTVVVLTIQ